MTISDYCSSAASVLVTALSKLTHKLRAKTSFQSQSSVAHFDTFTHTIPVKHPQNKAYFQIPTLQFLIKKKKRVMEMLCISVYVRFDKHQTL